MPAYRKSRDKLAMIQSDSCSIVGEDMTKPERPVPDRIPASGINLFRPLKSSGNRQCTRDFKLPRRTIGRLFRNADPGVEEVAAGMATGFTILVTATGSWLERHRTE